MNVQKLTDRYHNDPTFKAWVDLFFAKMCEDNGIQPYEIKDAAFLAEYKWMTETSNYLRGLAPSIPLDAFRRKPSD